jgi:putative ABC transport system permease protein
MEFYLSAIMLGLCLSAMSLGIFITMKIFNIPDITTDGSYTLGAVISAILLTHHWHPALAIPVVMASGALAGALTGIIHTKLKIEALLAGILVMTALYSINLVLLGRSNVPLLNVSTIFSSLHIIGNSTYNDALVSLIFIIIIAAILAYVLMTDFGIAMRATGNSASMTRALGINNDKMKIIGLAIANALTALSGYLVCQYQNHHSLAEYTACDMATGCSTDRQYRISARARGDADYRRGSESSQARHSSICTDHRQHTTY